MEPENDSMTALKPYVRLDRSTLLEDVDKFCFICDWNDFKVESLSIRPERPLLVMSMTRPRRSFGLPCKLMDRDAFDWLTDDYMAKEIREGLLPHIAKPRLTYDKKREERDRPLPAPWMPLFRLQLNRIEDAGELGLCRIALVLGVGGDGITSQATEKKEGRSGLAFAGEILLTVWRARAGAVVRRNNDPTEYGTMGGDIAPEFMKWVSRDHNRPCVALEKSPLPQDVLLRVGDWSFQIWRAIVGITSVTVGRGL